MMFFLQCPMADSWDCITVGMKVEVINTDCPVDGEVYWIASVIRLAGECVQQKSLVNWITTTWLNELSVHLPF